MDKTVLNPVAKIYGTALAALPEPARSSILSDLHRLSTWLDTDASQKRWLSRLFDATKQKEVLRAYAAENDFSPEGLRLLNILIQNNRVGETHAVLACLQNEIEQQAGTFPVHVENACSLDESELQTFKSFLSARFEKEIKLSVSVNKDLQFGCVLFWNRFMMDVSWKTKKSMLLEQCRARLLKEGV